MLLSHIDSELLANYEAHPAYEINSRNSDSNVYSFCLTYTNNLLIQLLLSTSVITTWIQVASKSLWDHSINILLYPLLSLPTTCMHAKSLQSCLTLCDPIYCSPPGSSVHRILQARMLEWVAMPSFRGSSWLRDQTLVSYVSFTDRQVLFFFLIIIFFSIYFY